MSVGIGIAGVSSPQWSESGSMRCTLTLTVYVREVTPSGDTTLRATGLLKSTVSAALPVYTMVVSERPARFMVSSMWDAPSRVVISGWRQVTLVPTGSESALNMSPLIRSMEKNTLSRPAMTLSSSASENVFTTAAEAVSSTV